MNVKGRGIKGYMPWSSPESSSDKARDKAAYKPPSQEEIDMCLSCDKPKCTNCIDGKRKSKYYISAKRRKYPEGYLEKNIVALHHNGYKVAEIARIIGITKQTVYVYLRQSKEREQNHESNKQHHAEA